MSTTRAALIGVLTGVLLASGTFAVRDGLEAFAKLKARVTVIEQFLAAVTRAQ